MLLADYLGRKAIKVRSYYEIIPQQMREFFSHGVVTPPQRSPLYPIMRLRAEKR